MKAIRCLIVLLCVALQTVAQYDTCFTARIGIRLANGSYSNQAQPFALGDTAKLTAIFNGTKYIGTDTYDVQHFLASKNVPSTSPYPAIPDNKWNSKWSVLPFHFYFFGKKYDSLLIGDNGLVTFDPAIQAGSNCPSAVTQPIPSTIYPGATIFGCYMDQQDTGYHYLDHYIGYKISGTAPCRTAVIGFNRIYNCAGESTYYIMLHEGSNVVSIELEKRAICYANSSGNAICGIQNGCITKAAAATGGNAQVFNVPGYSNSLEGWYFHPVGYQSVLLKVVLYDNGLPVDSLIPYFSATHHRLIADFTKVINTPGPHLFSATLFAQRTLSDCSGCSTSGCSAGVTSDTESESTENGIGSGSACQFNVSLLSYTGTAVCGYTYYPGQVYADPMNATGTIYYAWNNDPPSLSSTYQNIFPGTSQVYVEATDAVGCTSTAVIYNEVEEQVFNTISTTATDPSCANNDGTVSAIVNWIPFYQPNPVIYQFSNGINQSASSGATITNLSSGVYMVTVSLGNCYATASQTINVPNTIFDPPVTASTCAGIPFGFYGNYYSNSGTYFDTVTGSNGCPEIRTLQLNVTPPATRTLYAQICSGSYFQWYGTSYSVSGSYSQTVQTPGNCDSVFNIQIEIIPLDTVYRADTVCAGNTVTINGQTYATPGVYTQILPSIVGCDTVFQFTLANYPVISITTINDTICENGEYYFHGNYLSQSGIYYDTLLGITGCDSVIALALQVVPTVYSTTSTAICEGYSYNFNGLVLSVPGIYYDTLVAASGCDSIVKLLLQTLPVTGSSISEFVCFGDSFDFYGNILSQSGLYSNTLQSVNGCDSIVQLQLIVAPPLRTVWSAVTCSNYPFLFNGLSLNHSGVYIDTTSSATGCDSILELHLTVNHADTIWVFDTVCPATVYVFNGNNLTDSGVYAATLTNRLLCDSLVNLHLSLRSPDSFVTVSAGSSLYVISLPCGDTMGLVVPNALTPNGDGVNDFFGPLINTPIVSLINFTVYDRSGAAVYEGKGNWDGNLHGEPQSPGTYSYVLKVNVKSTVGSGQDDIFTFHGSVMLFR